MQQFIFAFEGRIRSLADTHSLLSLNQWQGVSLADLVSRELAPYANGDNVSVSGVSNVLTADAAQAMAMVLHELVTNAAKYGALSTRGGKVSIHWAFIPGESAPTKLRFEWLEMGGPPVIESPELGYGTSVIRTLIPYELDGTVDLQFAAKGVRCSIEFPS